MEDLVRAARRRCLRGLVSGSGVRSTGEEGGSGVGGTASGDCVLGSVKPRVVLLIGEVGDGDDVDRIPRSPSSTTWTDSVTTATRDQRLYRVNCEGGVVVENGVCMDG